MKFQDFPTARGIATPARTTNMVLSGTATDSGRNGRFCRAALTPVTNVRSRAEAATVEAMPILDDSDNDNPTNLQGCKFERIVVVVVDMQVACTEGASSSSAGRTLFCKYRTPKVLLIKICWAAVNTTVWGCDTTAETNIS